MERGVISMAMFTSGNNGDHLSSRLLSKNLKFKFFNNNIASCEAWSLTLMEELRLRVFENMILMRMFGAKRDTNGEGGVENASQ